MSIRWKFLIIILVFSLTPLLVYVVLGQREMFHLGETISTYSYNSRALSVSQELENLATDYARTFMREKEFLELVLTILVGDVELVLAENPGIGAKLYFAEDFDDPHKAPPDVVRSPKYRKQVPGMALEPVRISFGYQVLRLRQGVEQSKVAKDIARVTDRPNEATHDRGNGATWKRSIWGLGLVSVLVHFTSFRNPYFW